MTIHHSSSTGPALTERQTETMIEALDRRTLHIYGDEPQAPVFKALEAAGFEVFAGADGHMYVRQGRKA